MILPARIWVLALIAGVSFAQTEGQAPPPVPKPEEQAPARKGVDARRQPKRILGIMPNYRAVSAGTIPPPPTPKEAFKIATENSFDYSSFIFVGVTSLMAVQPEQERGRFPLVGKFRPAGGDFQGMGVYRSDVFWGRARRVIFRARQHRLDEPAGLSLGMVASLQSPLPFYPAKSL